MEIETLEKLVKYVAKKDGLCSSVHASAVFFTTGSEKHEYMSTIYLKDGGSVSSGFSGTCSECFEKLMENYYAASICPECGDTIAGNRCACKAGEVL